MASGSPTHFTNGKQTGRCGDPVDCGSSVASCSGDTFVGNIGKNSYGQSAKITIIPQTFKPGYSEVDYGNLDDDPDTDDGLNIYPPVTGTPTLEQVILSKSLDVSPTTTINNDDNEPPIQTPLPFDCTGIPEIVPSDLQLTTNFNLLGLTTDTAISDYPLQSQHSLSEQHITCNLLAWSENIGEPLLAQYGTFVITSGFRHGSSRSQHEKGQAADIQFPGKTNTEIYNISIWIRDNLDFDQLILEYGGNRPWIHVSYKREGNRVVSASNKFGTRVSPGNYKWKTLIDMV